MKCLRLILVVSVLLATTTTTVTAKKSNDVLEQRQVKIVNGEPSQPHRYPWMVNILFFGDFHLCGGSLYNRHFIVTAAHCFPDDMSLNSYTLVLGDYNHLQVEKGQVKQHWLLFC